MGEATFLTHTAGYIKNPCFSTLVNVLKHENRNKVTVQAYNKQFPTQRNRKVCVGPTVNAQMASLWFLGKVGSHSYGTSVTSQSSAHWRSLMWPWRPGNHPLQLRWRYQTKLPSMLGSQQITISSQLQESLGPANKSTVHFLTTLGKKIAQQTGEERETAFCFSVHQSWYSTSIACYSPILLSTMTAQIKCHSSHFPLLIFCFQIPRDL